ncbi:delta subunit RNA polymerase [Streptococcus agalactiae CJB111]|nr:delta subunit RNA polymerase [Streptococcus agalactiae CJB111]
MELEVFAGQEKSELSMIEVARAILEQRGRDNEMYFSDLVNDIQTYLGKSDSAIRESLPFFYSDLNTDGSFIPLGENNGDFVHGMLSMKLTRKSSLLKKMKMALQNVRRNVSMLSWMVMKMLLITMMMIQKMKISQKKHQV